MFAELKEVVELVRGLAEDVGSFRSRKRRHETISELLHIYFTLLDVVRDGRGLLALTKGQPRKTLKTVPIHDRPNYVQKYQEAILNQGARLYAMSRRILNQEILAFADPSFQSRLSEVVGYKFDRVKTLHGVVAGLVLSTMFALPTEDRDLVDLVQSMYRDRKGKPLQFSVARKELDELEKALTKLRETCGKFASSEDLLRLSKRARGSNRFELLGPADE
jgi:hypothetical protein